MILNEKELIIPKIQKNQGLLEYVAKKVSEKLSPFEMPVRFVITKTDDQAYHCELGVLSEINDFLIPQQNNIFNFKKRSYENVEKFNAVLLIPTGIGTEIGGHSGDGGPVARLLATACDNLITHPNVVNAADINVIPENALYVEGSVITRLLMGTLGLQKVRSNRVMLVIEKHQEQFFYEAAINAASAARAAMGLDCPLVVMMNEKFKMRSYYSNSGRAVGQVEYLEHLCKILNEHHSQYDAVALSSVIEVPADIHKGYYRDNKNELINPWGGVEAMLTHALSLLFDIPSAHSPMMESKEILNMDIGVVDPRKSAEAVSTTFLHSILKGLHKSPKIINNPTIPGNTGLITAADISCLVIPDGCVGLPTLAALEQGIPVIAVKENRNRMQNNLEELPFAPGKLFIVDNYLEAAGVINALKAGVTLESVRRPLSYTKILETNPAQLKVIESLS